MIPSMVVALCTATFSRVKAFCIPLAHRVASSVAEQRRHASVAAVDAAFHRIEAAGLWGEIKVKISDGGQSTRLSEQLAAICRSVAWPDNQQNARHWLWCVVVVMWLAIPFDTIAIPHAFTQIVLGHGVLSTVVLALALRAWKHERSEMFQGISACLVIVTVMVAAAMTGNAAGGADFERFLVLAFFAMLTGLFLLPLSTFWMVVVAVVLNACFVLFQAMSLSIGDASGWLFTLYLSAFNVAIVFTRYLFDRRQTETILLRLNEAHTSHLMRRMALTDALTGLRNRKAMTDEFTRLIGEAPSGTVLSVAMIDIDDFKRLNDTLGHAAGDQALRSVGALFANFSKATGAICGRIGGEEFLVLLPGLEAEAARQALGGVMRQLDGMNLPNPGSRVTDRVTLSVGLVTTTLGEGAPHPDQESLMQRADVALYESKNSGRNRITSVSMSSIELMSI